MHRTFLEETITERLRYRAVHRALWRGSAVFVLAMMLTVLIAQSGSLSAVAYGVLVFLVAVFGIRTWNYLNLLKEAQDAYSFSAGRQLVPVMSTVLGRTLAHIPEAMHHEETIAHLTDSSLFTDRIDDYETDDCYEIAGKLPGSVRELRVTRTERNGKQSTTVTLFSGLFGIFTLPRTLTGSTYISTEGDGSGFAHRGLWESLTESGEVKETELESNVFERDLHVASSDPVEARYILTPNVMASLHEWWLEHKATMRIAFKGSMLYIALPDNHIVFRDIPTAPTREDMQKYLSNTLRPLWRIVSLTEQVRL
ncbi:DUF3137 domain-containing protein [Patescibacteria group bacterium]|nr:DUF3137 domain-containing protein [Patescibacteria group bacterium]